MRRTAHMMIVIAGFGLACPAICQDVDWNASLGTYCLDCHSQPGPSGGLDLAPVAANGLGVIDADTLTAVRRMLARGDMPPEGNARPELHEVAAMIAAIDRSLKALAIEPTSSETAAPRITMRRLNRIEYENTIRDLLAVDFDAASFLPADDVGHGFDNIGDVLSMPPLLLEKYFDAAERIALEAFPDPLPDRPVTRRIGARELRIEGRGTLRGDGIYMSSSAQAIATHDFPITGRYRIRAEVGGQQAGPELVKIQFFLDQRRLDIVSVPETYDEPGTHMLDVDVPAGPHRFGVAFVNDYYDPDHPDRAQRDRNCAVFSLSIEGPMDLPAGARPNRLETSLRDENPERWVRETIRALARRAFRRPVTRDDVLELLRVAGPEGTPESRVRSALAAILVSPRFLFRAEPAGRDTRLLDDYEIATRLSYFIWSSMPDDVLFAAAQAGDLTTAEGIVRETSRMLDDPRSIALAQNFATQWLQVRDLELRQPDPRRFPDVDGPLLEAMKAETILFFDAIVRDGRPIEALLSSDFTFLNETLADLYGVPGVRGEYLRRVRLPDPMMSSIVTQASVLTATSNPTRTSPVKRGKWVLEVLLDAPPPPPPPGVVSFEEAQLQSGGGTVREILARHRADPNCSVCHRRMDALGFSLEHYDPVGRYRKTINGLPVDSVGELPDGQILEGADDLQKLLLAGTDFRRSLVRHLMTYALGRGLTEWDESTIERILHQLDDDATIRSLVYAIVETDQFRTASPGKGHE